MDRNASDADIKKSHRKLCLKHHPDKGEPLAAPQRRPAHALLGTFSWQFSGSLRAWGAPACKPQPAGCGWTSLDVSFLPVERTDPQRPPCLPALLLPCQVATRRSSRK